MANMAIQVEGLGKSYMLGEGILPRGTLYDSLAGLSARAPRRLEASTLWALRDLGFEVAYGEVTGVIGRNGAGKSTLLKILSRITGPTEGRATVRGRLASLLEVGTGFHPELTGRENVFLNGSILGMTRAEVRRRFDEIVAFAEIERFVDTPVKRYSSGMYVRLAFAVAAHLDAEILVVDEVLAVGDAAFQAKCLRKMSAIGERGATVLVVSHNLAMMRQLCSRALLLERGRLVCEGSVDEVGRRYMAQDGQTTSSWTPPHEQSGPFKYEQVFVREAADERGHELCFRFTVSQPFTGRISAASRNDYGVLVWSSCDTDAMPYINKRWLPGRYEERCALPAEWLAPGRYSISISRPLDDGNELVEDVCTFDVDAQATLAARDGRGGVVAPLLSWHSEVLAPAAEAVE